MVKITKIEEMNTLDDLIAKCAKKLKVADATGYGLKTANQSILIMDLGDIVK